MKTNINYINFDMYSKKLGFYYNNHEKISSFFGFFLTIFYIFGSLILFLYEIIVAIKRKELKVYDTNIYSQEMPIIDIGIDQLYFAFGLEYPNTANRYIDESIYTVDITFLDRRKINDEFITVNQKKLEIEKCKVENFGKNYQNLFVKDELNNSYCLKDFNYTLTFAGNYKFDRITYIRILVYPCINSTKNNFACKPQETIDSYFNSGYFSIVLKDFGLNPSNYSFPRVPTLQDLYTTIDKRFSKNYILNFGLTEIQTDTSLINEQINKNRYLQFRKVLETFSFRDEKDYLSGQSLILVQLRLEDTIYMQKRTYTKISEVFSFIGGYMQLMNTVFLLLSTVINKIYSEIKIVNSIFNFNVKENKISLKLKSFNKSYKKFNSKIYENSFRNTKEKKDNSEYEKNDIKSRNDLILKENKFPSISFINISNKNSINKNSNYSFKKNNNHILPSENFKKSRCETSQIGKNQKDDNFRKIILDINNIYYNKNMDFFNNTNMNIFIYLCSRKNSKHYQTTKLYKKGIILFRKKMDIIHVFSLLSILENYIKIKY
jgi:hypothetical protein